MKSDALIATRAASIRSIAVLPLENLSGNPAQDYLADSMTDELITQLARTKGLRVISRTSVMQLKGVHRPLKDIARELGVDGILEGSVLNSDGRVRVTVQLVHAPSDTHVWAQSYIRDSRDLLLLQQELAENVAKEVHSAALPPKPSGPRIAPEAHDAYLRGRYNWFAEALRLGGKEQPAEEGRIAYTKGGNQALQEWRLAYLKQMARKQYVSPLEFASAYARLGQKNEVFQWLEKAYDDHVPKLVRIQQDSDLNSVHGDPRFQALVKRIGLPPAF